MKLLQKYKLKNITRSIKLLHRPFAAGSRQLSRSLAALEAFLNQDANKGNDEDTENIIVWNHFSGGLLRLFLLHFDQPQMLYCRFLSANPQKLDQFG